MILGKVVGSEFGDDCPDFLEQTMYILLFVLLALSFHIFSQSMFPQF